MGSRTRRRTVIVDVLIDRWALSLPAHVPPETLKGFTLGLAKQAPHGKRST